MNKTAIVIDDDLDSVEIFSQLLEEQDVSVIGKGYSGKEAIDLYREKKPDLVFVDLRMPDGTGFHAIRGLKSLNDSAKIIAVTAESDFSTKKKLMDLDVHGTIFKPIDMAKVMDLIQN